MITHDTEVFEPKCEFRFRAHQDRKEQLFHPVRIEDHLFPIRSRRYVV